MENHVNIAKTEVLSDKKFTLKNFEYRLTHNGQTTDKKTEVYFRPDAAAVLLYDQDKQTFLLARQFRLPAYLNGVETGYVTEVCAGLIDDDGSPEDTAIREVMEETGYAIKHVEKIGEAFSSVGGIPEKIHLFIAPYSDKLKTGKGGGLEEEGEHVETFEMRFDEARQLLKEGGINDMKTILLLQHFFLFKV